MLCLTDHSTEGSGDGESGPVRKLLASQTMGISSPKWETDPQGGYIPICPSCVVPLSANASLANARGAFASLQQPACEGGWAYCRLWVSARHRLAL